MSAPRKLYIKTYGCQMNVYDSERMAEAMGGEGYVTTDTPDDADMILLNTCHIREKAAEKVYSELGRCKRLKDAKPDAQDRRRGLRRAGRGERDHAPPADGRPRRRPAKLSPPAGADGTGAAGTRRSIPNFPKRTSSSI